MGIIIHTRYIEQAFEFLCTCYSPPFKSGKLCSEPLGMEDRRIADNQITATDYYVWTNFFGPDSVYSPEWARLNEDWAWSTHMLDTNQYIQVAFEQTQYIVGVITQGYSDAWVETYKVEYTEDGTNYQYITEPNGQEKVCLVLWGQICN